MPDSIPHRAGKLPLGMSAQRAIIMNFYTNRPDGFGEIRNQLLLRVLPLALLALAVGYSIASTTSASTPQQEAEVLPFFIPLMLAALGIGIYRSLQQQKRLYHSYTLTISDTTISRELNDTTTLAIPIQNITRITRNHNGTFTIQGATAQESIGVYRQVEPYDVLAAQLMTIHPITIQTQKPVAERLRLPLVLLTLGLMALVYGATNRLLVAISGTALSALLLWSFFSIQRSLYLDEATKRRHWWILVVLFSIVATTIGKLLP
ncbi:hypothetical protein [Hymenobacter volaticus]|uniref:PH domain-containing protein n=1 Tax=Hymenobacter volaticus TaxID=2932254 RepID=A0ABY4GEW1_9BACT|nr:hypothetical protein [Hymenobacter volaticus]UOQ69463.1 hypothetical protein MUN86_28710 [Hymenobacter volaticus]